ILHSSEIPSPANAFTGENLPGFSSPEMDRIIDALEVELDGDKRRSLWAEAQHLYASELPSLPLYFRSNVFVLPKWLSGVRQGGRSGGGVRGAPTHDPLRIDPADRDRRDAGADVLCHLWTYRLDARRSDRSDAFGGSTYDCGRCRPAQGDLRSRPAALRTLP